MKYIKCRDVKNPNRGTKNSAGIDFYIPNDYKGKTIIAPGESTNIPSGIKMILEPGTVGVFMNKSSIGSSGLIIGACVVDSDYRGEVHHNLHNVSNKAIHISPGQKITQMLIWNTSFNAPEEITSEEFEKNNNTERGDGGYGSTGKY